MKNKILVVLFLALTLSSCKLSLTVMGTPGTEIYCDSKKIGTIGDNDTLNVKISRKDFKYSPFMVAKLPNSDVQVPFATNIKVDNKVKGVYAWHAFVYFGSLVYVFEFFKYSRFSVDNFYLELYDYIPTQTNTDLVIIPTSTTDTIKTEKKSGDILDVLN